MANYRSSTLATIVALICLPLAYPIFIGDWLVRSILIQSYSVQEWFREFKDLW